MLLKKKRQLKGSAEKKTTANSAQTGFGDKNTNNAESEDVVENALNTTSLNTLTVSTESHKPKRKKPFYKRWYFITLIIIALLILIFCLVPTDSIADGFDLDKSGKVYNLAYKYPSSWKPSPKNDNEGATYFCNKDGEEIGRFSIYYVGSGNSVDKPIAHSLFTQQNEQHIAEYDTLDVKGADDVLYCTTTFKDNNESWQSHSLLVCKNNVTFGIEVEAKSSAMRNDIAEKLVDAVDFVNYTGLSIQKLTAKYNGSRKAHTVIDSNSNISVNGKLSDGTDIELTNWAIKNPKTLVAGKTSIVKITCQGKSINLKVKCSTLSKSQYMAKCNVYTYSDLAHKSTGKLQGKKIKLTGVVTQVIDTGNYLVDVGSGWDLGKFVHVISDGSEAKIVEDDNITIYGVVLGDYEYETVLGANKKIPEVKAKYFK